ncbi:hypothetical protein [Polaribacter sp. Hel_I_88]|uniref:hypothetical protein n=1 Tax=Polaribacter sp. Hel_I_88 TaxID=1250006 RepID=UPI00047E006B|nr:hypothetical protein [Polaribacter sp. Hel_I_88]
MKPYIFSILFLISINVAFSQTKEVILNKSFSADENTILTLDLDNADVHIIASEDDKIHFNYEITFYNYSKRKINNLLHESVIKTAKKNNQIFLEAKNSRYLNIDILYRPNFDYKNFENPINNVYKDYLKNYFKTFRDREKLHITKDSLIEEIDFSLGSDLYNYIKRNIDSYPLKKPLKTDKKIEKKFVITVPENVQLRINAIESDINCDFDITTEFRMESFKGAFKFREINGKNNKIISSNGILETYGISNTKIDLRDMSKINISSISNSKVKLESSRIQIGEIGENVAINDFSSKIYLYNFHKNFKKFNFTGDYSELNLYKVKDTNFSMDVSGYNTNLNMDGTKTSFGASKEKELTKILQKKRKENSPFLGNIEVILKNGILNIK